MKKTRIDLHVIDIRSVKYLFIRNSINHVEFIGCDCLLRKEAFLPICALVENVGKREMVLELNAPDKIA